MNATIQANDVEDVDMCPCEEEIIAPVANEAFIQGLGIVLSHWVGQNVATNSAPDRFHSSQVPSIGIQAYIQRLRKYFQCSDECFVLALVYIDRIGKKNESMAVCDATVHRLLATAVMMAAKFHEDKIYTNRHYGKVSGLGLKEVNLLEAVMLRELDWKLIVSVEDYLLYHRLVSDTTT
jgi:hypothetical protein